MTLAGIVGAVWAMWHLPLFFLSGSYQHGLVLGLAGLWLFMLSLLLLFFDYAAVYWATGDSASPRSCSTLWPTRPESSFPPAEACLSRWS
jgi:hypothetical protein